MSPARYCGLGTTSQTAFVSMSKGRYFTITRDANRNGGSLATVRPKENNLCNNSGPFLAGAVNLCNNVHRCIIVQAGIRSGLIRTTDESENRLNNTSTLSADSNKEIGVSTSLR